MVFILLKEKMVFAIIPGSVVGALPPLARMGCDWKQYIRF